MLDAGSTGSRIHIYKFNYCKGAASPTLESEIFMQVKPGLSAYPNDPSEAATSLNSLLDRALEEIPKALHSCTPLALKATAGLRLLGLEKSKAILDAVRSRLTHIYPFPIADLKGPDGVVVMDGSDEGVYAWITVNYLTNRIGGLGDPKKNTAAVMDLGGGSTQIVFEPITVLEFGGHKYELYQHSYLNYGLMEGRKRLKAAAVSATSPVFPCLLANHSLKETEKALLGSVNTSFTSCSTFVSSNLFSKSATCSRVPCSFDGIHQPKLDESFPFDESTGAGDLYAFSYFYDKTRDIGLIGSDTFTVGDIKTLGERVCKDELKGSDETGLHICMDLVFIHGLLSTGYELNKERKLHVLKKIDGFETGWCLGAAIQMIDSLTNMKSNFVCKPT